MRVATSLLVFLLFVASSCNKNDNQPGTSAGGSGETVAGEPAAPPVPDKLEFFGYWIGMPFDEFLERARKTHGFELNAPNSWEKIENSANGIGKIEGADVQGRFYAVDGKLRSFHVFHTTTEPMPMKEMAFYKSLMGSVGRAEGGCQGEGDDMHCRWEAGGAALTYSKTEGWPKGAPAMEHEYKVYAEVEEPRKEPDAEELARREDETAQKKREEVIKQAIAKAEQIQLMSRGKLKPTANDCLWKLNNEDPDNALKVARCMLAAEVYNDLRACSEPCRPPDPSLAK